MKGKAMFCTNCGKEIDDDQKFCETCGTRVGSVIIPIVDNMKNVDSILEEKPVKIKKKGSSGLNALAIILAVFAFIFTLVLGQVHSLRDGINEKNIKRVISNLKLEQINYTDGESLSEYIFEKIDEEDKIKYNLSEDDIDEILADEDVKEFISDKVVEGLDFVTSDTRFSITTKEIVSLVKSQRKNIYKITGYEIKDEDLNDMERQLKKEIGAEISTDDLDAEVISRLNIVRLFISNLFIYLFGALIIIMIVLVAILKRPRPQGVILVASLSIAVGVIFIIESLVLGQVLPSVLKSSVGIPVRLGKDIIAGLISSLRLKGIIIVCAGVVSCGASIVANKILLVKRQSNSIA